MIITKYKGKNKVVIFRSIGNVFNFLDIKLKVKKASIKKHCLGCIFEGFVSCGKYKDLIGYCYINGREDKKNVIFVKCNIIYATIYKILSKFLGWEE
jgi:hypothetical protein